VLSRDNRLGQSLAPSPFCDEFDQVGKAAFLLFTFGLFGLQRLRCRRGASRQFLPYSLKYVGEVFSGRQPIPNGGECDAFNEGPSDQESVLTGSSCRSQAAVISAPFAADFHDAPAAHRAHHAARQQVRRIVADAPTALCLEATLPGAAGPRRANF